MRLIGEEKLTDTTKVSLEYIQEYVNEYIKSVHFEILCLKTLKKVIKVENINLENFILSLENSVIEASLVNDCIQKMN